MTSPFLPLLKKLGHGDGPFTEALADRLWGIAQRTDRSPQEQRLADWFAERWRAAEAGLLAQPSTALNDHPAGEK